MKARWHWFVLVPLALSLILIVATQFAFLEKSFYKEMGFGMTGPAVGLANYASVLSSRLYRSVIGTTFALSAVATAGCILFAYPLAYTIARMSSRWSIVMLTAVLLASLVSVPIKVLGLIIIFGKDGGLNRLLMSMGIVDQPVTVLGNSVGVVVGLIAYSLAFAVLLLYSVIRTIPVALEEAAAIQGCGRGRVLWRVVLPLSMPGLTAVALTVFNLSMGAFASTILMGGGRVLTLPVVIYQAVFTETKYATASALAMVLTVLVLLVNIVSVLLLARIQVPGRARSALARRAFDRPLVQRARDGARSWRTHSISAIAWTSERLARLGIRVRLLALLSTLSIACVYVFLFAPLLVIVGASLNGGSTRAGAVVFPPRRLSLDWYLAIPQEHLWSVGLSVAVAALAVLLACAMAIPAGLGLVRSRMPGRDLAGTVFRLPLQIPALIVGLSFFYAYYAIDDAIGSHIVGSFVGLVLAHFFVLTPYVIGSVTAVLQRFDERLEEAAQSLGTGRWRTFRRVTLPVIVPGIFAGAVYAFMVSFGDVPISLFLAGRGLVTFPVVIFHSLEMDFDATVLASSTLVMLLGMGLLLVVQRLIGLDTVLRSQGAAR